MWKMPTGRLHSWPESTGQKIVFQLADSAWKCCNEWKDHGDDEKMGKCGTYSQSNWAVCTGQSESKRTGIWSVCRKVLLPKARSWMNSLMNAPGNQLFWNRYNLCSVVCCSGCIAIPQRWRAFVRMYWKWMKASALCNWILQYEKWENPISGSFDMHPLNNIMPCSCTVLWAW